jgi:hypothetical protein
VVLDVIRALGRRWYVVLAGLLLTAGLVFGAYKASPPEYNARALVLLLPSKFDVGKGGNPLLQLDGLEQPASVLSAYFASAPVLAEVAQLSPTAEFDVDLDPSTRGPVIAVDVTDKTAAETLRVRDYLLTRIPGELQRLQQDADARRSAFVDSMLLVADNEAKLDIHGTIRLTIAALVVGLVGTGILAFAIDGLMERRKLSEARRGVAGSEGTNDDAVPEDVTEEVLRTGRSRYAAVDAMPQNVTEKVLTKGRSRYAAVDAMPQNVTEKVLATGRSRYTTGNGVSPEVGSNVPFDMWPEAPWATDDARAFDAVPSARPISREP